MKPPAPASLLIFSWNPKSHCLHFPYRSLGHAGVATYYSILVAFIAFTVITARITMPPTRLLSTEGRQTLIFRYGVASLIATPAPFLYVVLLGHPANSGEVPTQLTQNMSSTTMEVADHETEKPFSSPNFDQHLPQPGVRLAGFAAQPLNPHSPYRQDTSPPRRQGA